MRYALMFSLVFAVMGLSQAVQDKPKPSIKKSVDDEEDHKDCILLKTDLAKDAKIDLDGKSLTFAKFSVLMENAQHAFAIEEATIKNGKFVTITLVKK